MFEKRTNSRPSSIRNCSLVVIIPALDCTFFPIRRRVIWRAAIAGLVSIGGRKHQYWYLGSLRASYSTCHIQQKHHRSPITKNSRNLCLLESGSDDRGREYTMAVTPRFSSIVMMEPIICVGVLNIGCCTLLPATRRVMARGLITV